MQTADPVVLGEVVVTAPMVTTELQGEASSSSEGTVTQAQLEARTVYRAGELLEAVPGLIVSQHSGEGKANQFYLRGFNLDHGTDLRTSVDGILVNQRSHGHGQGWTDLNFVIPELASGLQYQKGPYHAELGDFASAGAVNLVYANALQQGIASAGYGENGYQRLLLADSPKLYGGHLLYAFEAMKNDGPFAIQDNYRRFNSVLRYSRGDELNGFNLTGMTYNAHWNATDQIPLRAVQSGQLDRFAGIDPTDGGAATRASVSGEWHQRSAHGDTAANGYFIRRTMRLYSNFTYFLDNPVDGDQFAQPDRRSSGGLVLSHVFSSGLGGVKSSNKIGVQVERDRIDNALQNTKAREVLSVTRADVINETSVGVYAENTTQWASKFRAVLGVRGDYYRFDVESYNAANSGKADDTIVNPKASLIFGPWAKTEAFVNAGGGFHSNDARGTVINIDPKTGDPAERVTPLARSRGYEVGARTAIIPGLQSSFTVYLLDLDSELVFIGDAGNTEAGGKSRRQGFEFANYYKPNRWLTIDADVAYAKARFRNAGAENRIPGAVEGVASASIAVDHLGPYFGQLQFRYFGPRPLIENNSARSKSTDIFNGRVGYRFTPNTSVDVEVFNILNREVSAIDYFYTSRLPGEPAEGVDDIHFHPIESRSVRVGLTSRF